MENICYNADCEYGASHLHGPMCTSTCYDCHPDGDVVEAEILPVQPNRIEWVIGHARGWRVELQPAEPIFEPVVFPGEQPLLPYAVRKLEAAIQSARIYAEQIRNWSPSGS